VIDPVSEAAYHETCITTTATTGTHPQINSIKQTAKSLAGNKHRRAMYLHIKMGHINMEYISTIVRTGLIQGVSKSVGKLKYKCPICIIAKATKIPKGLITQIENVPAGTVFHMDWMMVNIPSIRGFVCALTVVEARTRMIWGFPARSRQTPVHQIKFFIKHMSIRIPS
jgi:hypothetical protein